MGCDGGSIPTRDELVKLKKDPERIDQTEVNRVKYRVCAISKEPLRDPIVACPLGFILNKETVLKHLIEKSMPKEFEHIKGTKDLTTLHFTLNPSYREDTNVQDATAGTATAPYICSVTGLETSGRYGFSALMTCGCVFSNRALKEIPALECVNCRTPYSDEDILPLNATEEIVDDLRGKLKEKRAHEKAKKRAAKSGKKKKKNRKKRVRKESAKKGTAKNEETRQTKKKPKITKTSLGLPAVVEPKHKTEAWKSIFISSSKQKTRFNETFLCRNVKRT